MTTAALLLALASLQGSSFRIGFSFDAGWPAMGDEKDYAELLEEAGLDYRLDGTAWTGGIEALGDVSDKLRLRGGVSVSRFHGTYEDNFDPFGYTIAGILTGGLLFLFGAGGEDVVAMEDVATSIHLAGYYKLTSGPVLSIGGGPSYVTVTRSIDTPNTASSESAAGLGLNLGLRLDGESGGFLGLPIVFGAEGGYRLSSVGFDTEYSEDFGVDFSGLYVGAGTYLKL